MDAAVVRTFLVAISVCAAAAGVSAQRGAPKVDEILLRAGTFVQDTANSLTGVIADESYEQDLLGPLFDGGTRPRIGRRSMERFRSTKRSRLPNRSPRRSKPRTNRGSSTAI